MTWANNRGLTNIMENVFNSLFINVIETWFRYVLSTQLPFHLFYQMSWCHRHWLCLLLTPYLTVVIPRMSGGLQTLINSRDLLPKLPQINTRWEWKWCACYANIAQDCSLTLQPSTWNHPLSPFPFRTKSEVTTGVSATDSRSLFCLKWACEHPSLLWKSFSCPLRNHAYVFVHVQIMFMYSFAPRPC